MADVFVYRLEYRGRGCYHSDLFDYDKIYSHKFHRIHGQMPCPYDNEERGTPLHQAYLHDSYEGYKFAFRSIKQYRAWFRDKRYRSLMYAHEAVLQIYRINEKYVNYGNHQLTFDVRKAQKLITLTPA